MLKYINWLLFAMDLVIIWLYAVNQDVIIAFAKRLNGDTTLLVTSITLVLAVRVVTSYFVSRNKKNRWQIEANVEALAPELDKIPNGELHKEYKALNNVKFPFASLATMLLIELPILMIVYRIAHFLDGDLFGLALSQPNAFVAIIPGVLYLFMYKYTDWTLDHTQRLYMPLIAFIAGSTTNLVIMMYMTVGALTLLIMGHGKIEGKVAVSSDDFIATHPDALQVIKKPKLQITGDNARLFARTLQRTLYWGTLIELVQVVVVSAFFSNVWNQLLFLIGIVALDYVLPDKKYGWFK